MGTKKFRNDWVSFCPNCGSEDTEVFLDTDLMDDIVVCMKCEHATGVEFYDVDKKAVAEAKEHRAKHGPLTKV